MKITPLNELPKGRYESLAADIGAMTDEKARLYGDSVKKTEDIMRVLYPDGIPVSALRAALLLVRCCDKFCRIATAADGDNEDAWSDLVGYSLIGAMKTGAGR